ncbi:hypothetical protein RclHR1_31400003 [Rhizophagus clarus]|uniref:Uncharacterized protein n=1 Tax=Rhizophagus clarus TaxID=94130 RepID=A0A2Z6R7F4_9GLOM|nr:hypothetical protein RclHR1_31400003 [Rhizophagus clarus]
MDRYQKLMLKFIGEKYKIQVNHKLKNGERLHILVTHDEMTFQSNDGQKSDTIGRLKLSSDVVDDGIPHEIKTRAIPIFEKTHPGMVAVFAFDNSFSHAKLADDTLNAAYMNLNPGRK